MSAFNSRSVLIDIPSLQGSVLLGFVAFVEGDNDQDALLSAQAICMVQMLRLPVCLSSDPIQREVEIRCRCIHSNIEAESLILLA